MAKLLSPEEFEAEFGGGRAEPAPQADRGNLFGSAVDRTQAALLGIGEEYGVPFAEEARRRNQFEADETARRYYQTNPDRIQSFRDIRSLGDVGSYAADLAVQTTPALVGLGASALAGGVPGALAFGTALGKGEILQAQREEAGETDLLSATGGGLVYGAADALTGIGGMVARRTLSTGLRGLDTAGTRYLDELSGLRGVAARTAAAGTKGALTEAAGETLQQGTVIGGRMAVNPDLEFFSPENIAELQESAVAGGLLGFGVSGGLGGWRRSRLAREQSVDLLSETPPTVPETPEQTVVPEELRAPITAADSIETPTGLGGLEEDTTATTEVTKNRAADRAVLDEFGITPNKYALSLLDAINESGIPIGSDLLIELVNDAAEKPMGKKTLERLKRELKIITRTAQVVAPVVSEVPGVAQSAGVSPTAAPAVVGLSRGGQVAPTTTQAPVAPVAAAVAPTAITQAPQAPSAPAAPAPVIQQGTPSGLTTPQAQQTETQGQTAPAAAAAGITPAPTVDRLADVMGLSEEDQNRLDIAAMTGQQGLASTLEDEAAGQRVDEETATENQIEAALAARFAKSRNPARDRQILEAYLAATRGSVQGVSETVIQALATQYGVTAAAIRKIGNAETLVSAGQAAGLTRGQVLDAFDIADRSKTRKPETAERAEREQEAEAERAVNDPNVFSAGLAAQGLSPDAGFVEDSSRFWQEESSKGNPAADEFFKLDAKLKDAQRIVAALQAQGPSAALDAATAQVQALTAQLTGRVETATVVAKEAKAKRGEAKPEKGELSAQEKALREKLVAEADAKRKAERKGLEVGDTVVNPKLGTGVIEKFAGNGDATTATIKFQNGQTRELSVKLAPLEKINAVQEQGAAGVPVQPKTEAGQKVGRQVRRAEKPAAEGKAKTEAKVLTTKERYAEVTAGITGAPAFDSLTKAQQDQLADLNNGGNLNLAAVNTLLSGGQTSGTRFSKMQAAPKTKNTVERIRNTMAKSFRAVFGDYPHQDYVRVHQTAEQAFNAAGKTVPMGQLLNAQAFVDPRDQRVVHLIADNIPVGHEFAVLIHDVGVHVGLKGELGAMFKVLEAQVKSWATMPKSSLEFQVYEAATARVTAGRLEGAIELGDVNEELVAYAAEEAVARGVKPQIGAAKGLARWLAELKTVVERAFQNFFKTETLPDLSAQDLVNFSFAAASKQMQTTRQELGAGDRDNSPVVLRYYANRGSLADDSSLENLDAPGEETFYWGKDSKYGKFFTGVTTRARLGYIQGDGEPLNRAPVSSNDVRAFSMVVMSAESNAIAQQSGDKQDRFLQTFQAVEDPVTKVWSLAIFGPDGDKVLYYELWYDDKASKVPGVDGAEWTRLEGMGMRDNLRVLSEFRRRLTRALGEVPFVEFTRMTGSGINMIFEGGREGQADPEFLATRFSKAAPLSAPQARSGVNQATRAQPRGTRLNNINRLPKQVQQPANIIAGTLSDAGGKFLDKVMFTSDLVKRATNLGLKSADNLLRSLAARDFATREEERAIEAVLDLYADVPQAERGTGDGSVNRFIFDSTRTGKWGYGPKADPEMKARFDALSPQAKKLVEAMFTHGDRMLARKKSVVLDNTTSVFDAQIAAAKTDKEKAELRTAKKLSLKRYESLFAITEGRPYAPIKRNGNYVVIAKSPKYLAAEATGDTKAIEKLQASGDDYHVSFVDGKNAGRNLMQQLQDQGGFGDVQLAERDAVTDELFSNEGALQQLSKLRTNVDSRVKAGEKESGPLLNIINQMYLDALAEGSARKSEMKRRGVDGEVDMIASFGTQGRADANFLASLQYSEQVSNDLNRMREEAKTGDRTRKSEVLNELVRRYADSLDIPNTPILNKLARMSSVYFLASSPAYYLQNLTQPFMMSVPAMAGEHSYAKVNAELFKAYGELAPMMKSASLMKQLDFTKVPDDVKNAINQLVNRGRVDIGIDTELGEFKVDGESRFGAAWNSVDKGLRAAVQKGESINRLSTAIAAYRLAMSKKGTTADQAIDYAERILLETHGDYSRFNAPRAFNTSFGRIALQFRKFQLIQLTWYAKMIKQAYSDPAQRGAALRSLAFGLTHTGVLAGAMGLPGYAAVAWALGSLFGDDDEAFDLTDEIRKLIGDDDLANMVLRGVPTLGGSDWSGKIGAGNMLSIMPFSNADLTTRSGFYEGLGTLVAGASGGMVVRGVDGLGLLANGDYLKGMELVLPKGMGDVIKAYRLGVDGATRRNNDVILPADELDSMEVLWQAIGIPPAQMSAMYEKQERVRNVEQRFRDRTSRLKNNYSQAIRKGDSAAAAEARADWMKLQEARVRAGLKRQPLSNLLKAPREQTKRERETAGGVQFTRASRGMVEDIVER